MKKLPELLAPAGDLASVYAAIQAKADAVYIGIGTFNMRKIVIGKITEEILPEISTELHSHGMKLYITVNTIIYQNELDELGRFLDVLKPHADAVICSDWAVITGCKERNIPVHISTQLSCSNLTTAKFLASQGAERVVLARECTLDEIREIAADGNIETEVFIHGAQCVATSGRCFLSHLAYGCSSNRGACLQPCRREYKISEIQEGDGASAEFIMGSNYILSAKDVCALKQLPSLVEANVASLKIEGRARNPEYVQTVVAAYRQALDAIANNAFTDELQTELMKKLETVYHRPFSEGLMLGRPGLNQFCDTDENLATEKKLYAGIVRNYYPKAQVVDIFLHEQTLKPGMTLSIHGATTGVVTFELQNLQHDSSTMESASRGDWFTTKLTQKVRAGDKVYLILEKE